MRVAAMILIWTAAVTIFPGLLYGEKRGLIMPRPQYYPPAERVDSMKALSFPGTVERTARPPLSGKRLTREFVAGVVGGTLSSVAAASLILPFSGVEEEETGLGRLGGITCVLIGFSIGYPTGNSLGIYYAGTRGGQTGSYLMTLAGSAAGALISAGIILAADSHSSILWTPFVFTPAGGMIGFNTTRRYTDPPKAGKIAGAPGRELALQPAGTSKERCQAAATYMKLIDLRF